MIDGRVSILIPAHKEMFLSNTVSDLLIKSVEDIEVIICLDQYDPVHPIPEDNRITVIKSDDHIGMRKAINMAAEKSTGEFLMKCDAHCAFKKGFDKILKSDCKDNWVVVPRRYSLDPHKWDIKKGKNYIDYLTVKPPVIMGNDFSFKGAKWCGETGLDSEDQYYMERKNKDKKIDDIITFQGSCWFMKKSHFDKIGGLDDDNFGTGGCEAFEISVKTWLSDGRVVRNKNVWYAHLLLGRKYRLARGGSSKQKRKSIKQMFSVCFDYWPGKVHRFRWLIDKFGPLDGWPEKWFTDLQIEQLRESMKWE